MTEKNRDQNILILGYMEKFRCIGSACQTHCCQGWNIHLDSENFKKLKKALAQNTEDFQLFNKHIKRNRSKDQDQQKFAQILLGENGVCPFFGTDGLCEIHRRFGENFLSKTCFTYPRKVNQVQGRYEISGSLSCPEIARLCLLSPDSTALKIPEQNNFNIARLAAQGGCPASTAPFLHYINDIRDIALQFLSLNQFPISSRLFFISYFSNRISSFFHDQCPDFQPEQLASELDRLTDTTGLQELHNGFQRLSSPLDLPVQIVNGLLVQNSGLKVCRDLFSKIWDLYGEQSSEGSWTINRQALVAKYIDRRNHLLHRHNRRVELYLENYCKNYWLSNLYTESHNLLDYLQGMLARLAIYAFLFYSHPQLDPIIAEDNSAPITEPQEQLLDTIAVESFHLASRAIEHDQSLWNWFSKAVNQQGLASLAHLIQLLKFIQKENP